MKKFYLLALIFSASILLASASHAQVPTSTDSGDVVKITTKLVQVDVVVTDKKGGQVRDLRASDFELLQDGKAQKIVGFTYVPVDSAIVTATIERKPGEKDKTVLPPPARRSSDSPGRIIAIVVDDGACGASLWGINSSRDAVVKFVSEQMLPTDLVAIYRTRAGSSTFQQYTSDKNVLIGAAKKIRWYPPLAGCGSSDGSFNDAAESNTFTKMTADGAETKTIETEAERKSREYREDSIQNNQVVGTLGVLRYALKGLDQSPGRKLMFVMSDGLAFRSRANETLGAKDAMRDVTDAANRAGVVVNTFDVRGANVPGMIEARDQVYVKDDFNATAPISAGRIADARRQQEGLATLAYDTGGEFYQGQDRLENPMGEILRRETGYYLLAYEPNDETFKSKKFNSIEVKVKTPDLKVAYRSGFLGVPDAAASTPKRRTADSELYEAIAAPLPRAGLGVRLTAYFANSPYGSDFVRSTFHLDGDDLTFADEAGGMKKLVLDVVAVTMNEKNDVIDEFTRTHTLKFDPATATQIQTRGLVYAADVPVKKPGAYTFRVAVRDGTSKMLGSASQVVTIPDLKKSGMFASGLTVTGVDATGKFTPPVAPTAETAISLPASGEVPAIRQFKRGSVVAYLYNIYGSKLDAGKPRVSVKVNLYQNGTLLVEGKPEEIDLAGQKDFTRLETFSYMQLSKNADPGDYALQIIVTDLAAGAKNAVSSQWVDFEVVD